MKTADNEIFLIEFFRDVVLTDDPIIIGDEQICRKILNAILDENEWSRWIDSSSKVALPPDFYNDYLKIMMEVMRVDDHTFVNHKKQVVNPTLAKEKALLKDIKFRMPDMDLIDTNFVPIVDTGLPTFQDHNYDFYFDSFKRVVNKHALKKELYQKNHIGYKLVFFICDESTAYVELPEDVVREYNYSINEHISGTPHYYFLDRRFIRVLLESGVDYVVWFSPYKMINLSETEILPYPHAAVFDLKSISIHDKNFINYSRMQMISAEI